jgi:hypothetical protein
MNVQVRQDFLADFSADLYQLGTPLARFDMR